MKKILIASLLSLLFTSCITRHTSSDNSAKQGGRADSSMTKFDRLALANSSKMIFKILKPEEAPVKNDHVSIKLQFQNISNEPIKIVDLFDQLNINFSLEITFAHKTTAYLGPGLASFPSFYTFKYFSVSPRKYYETSINVSSILKKEDVILAPGIYEFKMRYINNIGKDCIIGSFESNTIQITVTN
jgi:hypothetical protein